MPVRLRTQKITIDLPRADSEPWVQLVIQRITLDAQGAELNVVDRWDFVNKKLSDVALEIYPYFEPVPALPAGQISVFSISDAIKSVAINWVVQKHGGTITADGEVIL